ncbi:Hypothetical protein EIN_207520, partial [Entamoeba invadens IP1]
KDTPAVIIIDNYKGWIDTKLVNIFKENSVFFHFIEPHSSSYIQPSLVCLYEKKIEPNSKHEDLKKRKRKGVNDKTSLLSNPEKKDDLEKILCTWRKQIKGLNEKYVKKESTEEDKEDRGKIVWDTIYKTFQEIQRRATTDNIILAFNKCGFYNVASGKVLKTYVEVEKNKEVYQEIQGSELEEICKNVKLPEQHCESIRAREPKKSTLMKLEEIIMNTNGVSPQ